MQVPPLQYNSSYLFHLRQLVPLLSVGDRSTGPHTEPLTPAADQVEGGEQLLQDVVFPEIHAAEGAHYLVLNNNVYLICRIL